MVKKSCDRCGLQWGLAKRCCTCGNSLILTKKNRCKKPQKQCSATAPLKICSECGLQWSTSKRKCTCGVIRSRLHRFPVDTNKVRRHFDSGWFDGEVVAIHVHDKLWTIRYTDGDEEDFNEDQLIRHSSQYNQKYNAK